jgi:sugar lactone lactonase YvrE
MIRSFLTTALMACCALGAVFSAWGQDNPVQAHHQASQEAYARGDFASYLAHLQAIDTLRPQHPEVYRRMAGAYSLLGNRKMAFSYLEKLVWLRADTSFQANPEFQLLWKKRRFRRLMGQMREALRPTQRSQTAFVLREGGLHPEGVAYDSATQNFYVGSIRKSRVLRLSGSGGEAATFLSNITDLYAVSGLAVDARRRLLWLCSNAMPEMEGYSGRLAPAASLHCYRLDTRERVGRFDVRDDGRKHLLGDVALHPTQAQTAYATDSYSPVVYRASAQADTLEAWASDPRWKNLQGLCFDPSGKWLFVADYSTGLYRIDVATKAVLALGYAPMPKGIDGLYWHEGRLIGIHNGIRPFRIVAYQLDGAQAGIVGHEVLESNHPLFGEPTLGTLVGSRLYYVADSPWGDYDQGAQLLPEAAEKPNHILWLPLR